MKMKAADITNYPNFAYYVENDLPGILSSPSILSAMRDVGQINLSRLRLALQWGHLPGIRIVRSLGACGEFEPKPGSSYVRIDRNIVRQFERGKGVRHARGGRVYAVGVTLLHELIHWGDNLDGIDRPGEEGEEFERRVYGSVIPC